MDYKDTINLPQTGFPMRAGLPKREPEWLDRWYSGKEGDLKTKDKFPAAVEIQLSLSRKLGDKSVVQKMSTVAPIRFSNNKKKKEEDETETKSDGASNENN